MLRPIKRYTQTLSLRFADYYSALTSFIAALINKKQYALVFSFYLILIAPITAMLAPALALTPRLDAAENLLSVTIADRYVREHQMLPIHIETMHRAPLLRLPLTLKISVFIEGAAWFNQQIAIDNWTDLSQGLVVNPVMPDTIVATSVRCLITLHKQDGVEISRVDETLNTVASLRQRFNTLVPSILRSENPLLRLRLEQVALLLHKPLRLSDFAVLDAYLYDLEQPTLGQQTGAPLQQQQRAGGSLYAGALRATADGSWQPYRLYLPADPQALTGLAIICQEVPATINKADWPQLETTLLTQAFAQGFACLQVYPAGDHSWLGISLERIQLSLAAAQRDQPQLQHLPLCLIGSGLGCLGALRAAMAEPQRYAALFLEHMPVCTASSQALLSQQPQPLQPPQNQVLQQAQQQLLQQRWERWRSANALQAIGAIPLGLDTVAPDLIRVLSPLRPIAQRGLLTRLDLGSLRNPAAWRWCAATTTAHATSQQSTQSPQSTAAANQAYRSAHFSDRPFICIAGRGANLAAQQQIQAIVVSLQTAWTGHSQGSLPVYSDQDVQWTSYPQTNIIFIGGPLDNQCLRNFLQAKHSQISTHLTWDQRHLRSPNGSLLRSQVGVLEWHIIMHDQQYWVLDGPHLRFSSDRLPLQNQQSTILLRDGSSAWQDDP